MLDTSTDTVVEGRVSNDFLRANNNNYLRAIQREISKDLEREFQRQGGANVQIMPVGKFTNKGFVMNKSFSNSEAMEPYIDHLKKKLDVKCGVKDPDMRKFEITLDVTFAFILKYFGESAYREALRMSKGRAGNKDLGIEPVEPPEKGVLVDQESRQQHVVRPEIRPTSPVAANVPIESNNLTTRPTEKPPTIMARGSKSGNGKNHDELKALVDQLIDDNDLKADGYTGRPPGGVDVYVSRVIAKKKLELARKLFKDNDLLWKEFPSSGGDFTFRFYTGDWPEETSGAPRSARASQRDRAEKPEPKAGRKKKVSVTSSSDGIRGLMQQLEEKLGGISAEGIADQVLNLLEEAGYVCVSKDEPFATTTDQEGAAAIVLDVVDGEVLKETLTSGLDKFLG